MKKLIALALALVMALALTVPALAAEEMPMMVTVGGLAHLGMDEEDMKAELSDALDDKVDDEISNNRNGVFYNTLSELLMALDAGYIQLAMMDEPTAQYVLSRNDAYAENHPAPEIEQAVEYSMLFLEEDAELCDSFNEAITAMKDDGTLDELAAAHIDGVIAGEDPEAVAFPSFDGAETVTVAVTGDVPPMDYVDDTGHAAGFNTAVLAEIAQRLEVNIELIQVDSGARALALASGRADVVFWAQSYTGEVAIADLDIPEGTVASEPYYTTVLCGLVQGAE